MKKNFYCILLAGLAFCCCKKNHAQHFQVGFEVTPHVSWLYNRGDLENNSFSYFITPGSSLGLSTAFSFNRHFGIAINALYSRQGQWYKTYNVGRCRELEYYKIPVMFVFRVPLNHEMDFVGKTGPQFGILRKASLFDRDGNVLDFDHQKGYKRLDMGATTYLGIQLYAGNLVIDIAVRADASLSGIENANYKKDINEPWLRSSNNIIEERKPTHNITLGATLGIGYVFFKKGITSKMSPY
ncbi:MAG TPA: outer membrane beta-barrel protein [Flavobacteriales bacterium]|nr:outer membrane beta-barrel protein [Flavobacteriales bacterium]